MELNKEDNMADKDFEKYMERKRKCKGYYYYKEFFYKYHTVLRCKNKNTINISFLNAEDAKWAYLEFHKILYKEGYEKAVSWISSYNKEYKKRLLDKYIDELECEWKYIHNCSNNYIVTEDGTVYSLLNFCLNKLKPDLPKPDGCRYLRYTIMTNKGKKRFSAHRLVANAFLEKSDKENLVIDHIDRNKLNNHYSNLRWISPRQNRMNSDDMDNAKGYYKSGKAYRVTISLLGSFVCKSFSNEKDAYNFSKKHRTQVNSLSEAEAREYIENLKLELKKERLKVTKGFSKNKNRYVSCIIYNKQYIYLGCFETEKEARQTYLDAVEKYHGIKIEE